MNEVDFLNAMKVSLTKSNEALAEAKAELVGLAAEFRIAARQLSLARSTLTWYASNLNGEERASAAEEDKGLRARVWLENNLQTYADHGGSDAPISA